MDHDDDLIGRLQGLGDKLDERRERSAHGPAVVLPLRAGGRGGGPRRLAQVAVVLVIGAMAVGAFLVVGQDGDDSETVRTGTTTTVAVTSTTIEISTPTASAEELAADLQARADDAVVECAAAEPTTPSSTSQALPPEDSEYVSVGIGPGCSKGWVQTASMGGGDLVPIYRTPEDTTVLGYWVAGAGWVTFETAEAAGYDPELLRTAAELVNGASTDTGG